MMLRKREREYGRLKERKNSRMTFDTSNWFFLLLPSPGPEHIFTSQSDRYGCDIPRYGIEK
jgi:hypothetical protein